MYLLQRSYLSQGVTTRNKRQKTLKNNNIIVTTINIPTRQQILAGFIFDFLSKLYYTIYIKIEEEIKDAKNSI